jgi:hypothetical protein
MSTAPITTFYPTVCVSCGSKKRTPYAPAMEVQAPGVDMRGRYYTHIVRRPTKCLDCGQGRIDRFTEDRSVTQDA